jgi:hypothetical protein
MSFQYLSHLEQDLLFRLIAYLQIVQKDEGVRIFVKDKYLTFYRN